MEPFETRLKRFVESPPLSLFLEVINSLSQNDEILGQLRRAAEHRLDILIFLGTHALMMTVGEKLLDWKCDEDAQVVKKYLETFLDSEDCQISNIAENLSAWRHTFAHRGHEQSAHSLVINWELSECFCEVDGKIHLNPAGYVVMHVNALEDFDKLERIFRAKSSIEQRHGKWKFILSYMGRRIHGDAAHGHIQALVKCDNLDEIDKIEKKLIHRLEKRFGFELHLRTERRWGYPILDS